MPQFRKLGEVDLGDKEVAVPEFPGATMAGSVEIAVPDEPVALAPTTSLPGFRQDDPFIPMQNHVKEYKPQKPTIILGIDPGKTGGFALITDNGEGKRVVVTLAMPATDRDLWEWFVEIAEQEQVVFAYIEKVSGFIGVAHPGSAMFTFGRGVGALEMALTAAGIPFQQIPPQKWQKALGISPRKKHNKRRQVKITRGKNRGHLRTEMYGGETDTEFKGRLRAFAQKLFPNVDVSNQCADALLLAEHCRRERAVHV